MARHFKTKQEAIKYRDQLRKEGKTMIKVFKKGKGMRNSKTKPYFVCNEFEMLNLY